MNISDFDFCLFLLRAFGIDFASFYCVLLVSILPLSIAYFWYRFCLFLLRAFGIDFASFYCVLSEQFGNPIENHKKRQNRYQKHAVERGKIDTKSTQ
jgi:hypothetical protein